MTVATYEQYRNMLRVDKLRLDDELEVQAEVRQRIAEEVAKLNTRMLEAKDALARTEANLLEDAKDNDPKLTVDMARAKVLRSTDRQRAWSSYQASRETFEMWKDLLESWDTKGHKLRDLGGLYIGDYFAIKSVSRAEDRPRREVRQSDAERREWGEPAPQRRERRAL